MKYIPSKEIVDKVYVWLKNDGIDFFSELYDSYGSLNVVLKDGEYPHCVHFREGMQVRNFLRSLRETEDWSAHDFDNRWEDIILEIIKIKKTEN